MFYVQKCVFILSRNNPRVKSMDKHAIVGA